MNGSGILSFLRVITMGALNPAQSIRSMLAIDGGYLIKQIYFY